MLRALLAIHRVVRDQLGRGLWRSLPVGLLIVSVQAFARTTLALDRIFFPGYRRTRIDRPIFIVGNPRSGTTILHRFLHDNADVCSFRVWQMFVPSLLGQWLLRPFVPAFARLNPARHYASDAHETGLDAVETDEALLSFRFLDGLFTFLFFTAWSPEDGLGALARRYASGSPGSARDLHYYADCLRRRLYGSKKQRFVGKPFTFVLRMPDVLAAFPDARFLYLVRDPAEVIPSGINMLANVSDKQFGTGSLPAAVRQRYYDNLYRGECLLYREFLAAHARGAIPPDNLLVIRFPDLMGDFERVMNEVCTFCELPVSDRFAQAIRAQAERQRTHVSRHRYRLDAFGLDEERIRTDLREVYEDLLGTK